MATLLSGAAAQADKTSGTGRTSRQASTTVTTVTPDFDTCFDYHGKRFALNADLLRGIARVESNMRPHAINNSHLERTHTRDIGLMQVNTSLLPKLAPYGIGERELLDPCTSIEVGAWVLADTLRRHGHSWQGVGAYNAACTQLRGQACTDARSRYAWAVYRRMAALRPAVPASNALAAFGQPARPVSGLLSLSSLVAAAEAAEVSP